MFRVVIAPLFLALLVTAGCAPTMPAQTVVTQVSTKTVTKTVLVEKRRTCTVTSRPMTKEEFCAKGARHCTDTSMSCGEAYYRYTTCGEIARDGGAAGPPNGIPCENICGKTPLAMAAKIRGEQPFSPPALTATVCDPA